MDTENYIKEAHGQLSNKNNYKALQTDPALQHNKMWVTYLSDLKTKTYSPKRKLKKNGKLQIQRDHNFILHPNYTKKIIWGNL